MQYLSRCRNPFFRQGSYRHSGMLLSSISVLGVELFPGLPDLLVSGLVGVLRGPESTSWKASDNLTACFRNSEKFFFKL